VSLGDEVQDLALAVGVALIVLALRVRGLRRHEGRRVA
jgi:hypothetical protein